MAIIKKISHILSEEDFGEILKKGGVFLAIKVGGMLVAYGFTYFIALRYGASVNGLVALSFSLLMFASVFGRLGIDVNLVKFYANPEHWEKEPGIFYRVLLKSFLVSSFLAGLLYACRGFIVEVVFEKPQLAPYIFWICLTIPCWVVIRVCSGLLRAKRLNHWYAFLDSPARFGFSLFFLFVFWNSSDSPLLAIKAHFYGVLLLMVFSLVLAIRNLGRISFASTQSSWRFLSEASPMMWTGAIIIFLGWTDTFILGIFESDDVVGVYFVVLKIAMLAGFSLEAINSILMPQMAKYYLEKESQQYKKVVLFATQLNFFITLGVIVFLLVFHKWILGLFGKEFIVGSTVLLILLGGQLIISFAGFSGMILLMTGHQKIYRNITGFCLLLNILLNLILTPLYGYVGTGIATVVSLVSLNLSSAIFIKRKLGFESWFNPFLFIKKVK